MNRTILRTLLQNYHPNAPEEQESKKTILAFIEQHPDCFERSLDVGHITASAWLVNNDNTKALMMHHAKLNIWVQVGGHCDGNPNVLDVAIREAQEESGINNIVAFSPEIFDIDIHLVPENKREKAHYHYDIRFLLRVTSDEQFTQNSESKELRWVSKDYHSLPTDSRSITRMFDKWLAI